MSEALDDVLRATAAIYLEGSPFVEVRILGGGPTLSGMFADAGSAAAAVAAMDGKRSAYIVANPINPSFVHGTLGKFGSASKGRCVGDADISRRNWFMVDIDPKRPTKVSATDDEVAAARQVLDNVAAYLLSLEWPEPMVALSGNGWWLMYRVDLPSDAEIKALYDKVLNVLALRFNTEAVSIDPSVTTAARLVPFFGTFKTKGPNTVERPHRRSEITKLGASDCVSLEQLQDVAAMMPSPDEAAPAGATGKGFLKLEEMLDSAGVRHTAPTVVAGTTWFGIFAADGNCPFGDSSGNGGKCGVGQDESGKLYGNCFAAKHPWSEWKEILGLARFFASGVPNDQLPVILLGAEMNVISAQAWAAIAQQNDPPTLFAFGSNLVEVE